jgi:YVTN family beta-propeller protein
MQMIDGICLMYNHNNNGRRTAWAQGFMAFFAMLAMGLGMMARPAEAQPFAYVTTQHTVAPYNQVGTVTVIDTASNTVMGSPIPVGINPSGVAVTPDGKHAYVTNFGISFPPPQPPGTVSVIDTATNMVTTTITVGEGPNGVAVTPDGKHAYVTTGVGISVVSWLRGQDLNL